MANKLITNKKKKKRKTKGKQVKEKVKNKKKTHGRQGKHIKKNDRKKIFPFEKNVENLIKSPALRQGNKSTTEIV